MVLLQNRFDKFLRNLVAVFYSVLVVVSFVQILFRYVLNNSLTWSEEFTRYLFVWLVMVGAAIGITKGVHVGVDFLTGKLPPTINRLLRVFSELMIIIFLVVLVIESIYLVQNGMAQKSPAMGIPMGYVYLSLPVGAGIMLINSVRKNVAEIISWLEMKKSKPGVGEAGTRGDKSASSAVS